MSRPMHRKAVILTASKCRFMPATHMKHFYELKFVLKILGRRVADAILVDGKHAIALRQAGRVVDLADSSLTSAFLQ
jgi:hypothetical protein